MPVNRGAAAGRLGAPVHERGMLHPALRFAYDAAMIRPILTELVLFLVPFALYALFLWATKRGGVLERANWPVGHVMWLAIVAFLLVIASFIVLAQWDRVPPGSAYTPAHMENGKLVPGETK